MIENIYKIGKIGKPHGVKGELTFMFDDDVFDRVESEYLLLMVDGLPVPFFFEEYRFKSDDAALVKFSDIDTQERAAELTGCEVYFPREMADESDELSFAQIIGYEIIDSSTGKAVGKIASVDDSTVNTLFELDNDILLPMAEEFIEDIDNAGRTITMKLPEGLLDL